MPPSLDPSQDVTVAPVSGLRRIIYTSLGLFFVGLGILGVLLPVLPTTPFLLLASFFFVRSSPRLHAWLLRSRVFGPFLRDWQQHHGVRLHVKLTALTVLVLVVAASAYFADLPWPLLTMLIVLALIGVVVVLRLPLIREEASRGACRGGVDVHGGDEPRRSPVADAPVIDAPVVDARSESTTSESTTSTSGQPGPLAAEPLERQQA